MERQIIAELVYCAADLELMASVTRNRVALPSFYSLLTTHYSLPPLAPTGTAVPEPSIPADLLRGASQDLGDAALLLEGGVALLVER